MNLILLIIANIFIIIGWKYGKKLWNYVVQTDTISREEAAMIFMERHVEFTWRPQIVDNQIATNVVNFDELKNKPKKERKNGYGLKTKI